MNLVSIERDWVVVVAGKNEAGLRTINARMRRIDLICKLVGPLFIALIDGLSTEVAILVNLGMNMASVVVEYYAIAKVYYLVPALQEPKATPREETPRLAAEDESYLEHQWRHVSGFIQNSLKESHFYFHHGAFLPSFSGALPYLTVLSFAGQMVTYLLAAGYSAAHIGFARTLSVAFEVAATFLAPWMMAKIGPLRSGIWLLSWQMISLGVGMTIFWALADRPIISASGLVGGTILSRVGLRGYDLCTQIIIQEYVEPPYRGAFSSVEAAWQNAFELCSFASTIIFSRPSEFQWPTLLSVVAVFAAGFLYASFVRVRRGHLFHLLKLGDTLLSRSGKQSIHEQGIERIISRGEV